MTTRTPRAISLFVGLVVLTLLCIGWPGRLAQRERRERPMLAAGFAPDVAPAGVPGTAHESDASTEGATGAASECRWRPAAGQFAMEIPSGWLEVDKLERSYLYRDPAAPLEGNFSLITLPNLFRLDLDGLLDDNRIALETDAQFHLDAISKVRIGEHDMLRVDYRGTPKGKSEEFTFAGLVWLKGSNQVVLTACGRSSEWPEIVSDVERSFESLEFVR